MCADPDLTDDKGTHNGDNEERDMKRKTEKVNQLGEGTRGAVELLLCAVEPPQQKPCTPQNLLFLYNVPTLPPANR